MAARKQAKGNAKATTKTARGGDSRKTGRGRRSKESDARVAETAKPGSKRALLIERLSRPEGAGITELTEALGWLPHTVRAALTGLRRKGYVITRTTSDREGQSVYRATTQAAENARGKGKRQAKRAA
jgi:predicted ArsR family transcriptional regulator